MTDLPPPAKRRSWIPIVVGILAGLVLLGAAGVGTSIYWVSRHIRSQQVSTAAASETFAEARARFQGQEPVITLDGQRPLMTREPAAGGPTPIRALHVLAYDADEGRLVRVEVPGWLLRLMPTGNFRLDSVEGLSAVRSRITVEDLERRGRGLVLDATTPDGAQVLIWTE